MYVVIFIQYTYRGGTVRGSLRTPLEVAQPLPFNYQR